MPDISLCRQSKCEARKTCYRYRAIPKPEHQSYMRPEVIGLLCGSRVDIHDTYNPIREWEVVDAEILGENI